MKKVELVIHPVRIKILQVLASGPKTTSLIAKHLPEVAKSTLYRHLRLLLDGGIIAVEEIRLVQGIQEKTFSLASNARLGPDDVTEASRDDHLRYFSIYAASLIEGFAKYLDASEEVDLLADRAGYSEITFMATPDEMTILEAGINDLLLPFLSHEKQRDRRQYKLAVVVHPSLGFGELEDA